MRIGLASYRFKNKDLAYNMSQIKKALRQAKEKQIDLLCFGEAFLQGFEALSWNYDVDKQMAVEVSSKHMKSIQEMMRKYQIDVLLGYIEKEDDRLYSSYTLIEQGQIRYTFRRISQNWKEVEKADEHYCEGNMTTSFFYHGLEFKTGLCGDVWIYPERFQTDAFFIWPIFVTFTLDDWKREKTAYGKHAGHIANHVFLINSICHDHDCVAHGGAFYYKNGEIEAELGFDVEDILMIDIQNKDIQGKKEIITEHV